MRERGEYQPVVAITFYSKQTKGKEPGYYTGIFNEENRQAVLSLQEGLRKAAETSKLPKPAPKVEITLYLVPQWKDGQTHTEEEYRAAKEAMIRQAQEFYGPEITIKDFMTNPGSTANQEAFLEDCESMGSIADLVKTRVITANAGRPCLQTDCNTVWADNDFEKLYQLTFGQDGDAYNASRCSEVYVSAHNKLVFTNPHSTLPGILGETLDEYCGYANDRCAKGDTWEKSSTCNGVYDRAFCEGMARQGVTYRVRVDDKYNPGTTFDFYPAKISDPRYKLMSVVIACQRESWRAGGPKDPTVALLTDAGPEKPQIKIQGVDYDYFHFKSLVRVLTNVPSWHLDPEKYKYGRETGDEFADAEKARNAFVSSQNLTLCMKIFADYYNEAKRKSPASLQTLANLIPETEAGNKLCMVLFNCTAAELHANPQRDVIFIPAEGGEDLQAQQQTLKAALHVNSDPNVLTVQAEVSVIKAQKTLKEAIDNPSRANADAAVRTATYALEAECARIKASRGDSVISEPSKTIELSRKLLLEVTYELGTSALTNQELAIKASTVVKMANEVCNVADNQVDITKVVAARKILAVAKLTEKLETTVKPAEKESLKQQIQKAMGEVEKARQDVIHASKIAAKAKFALWDATSAQKKITDSISADITAVNKMHNQLQGKRLALRPTRLKLRPTRLNMRQK